jgi:DNA-binding response OmpR family regulator
VSALLAVGHRCPDLLITDLHMPGMDGFHMLRELRKSVEVDKTTIVAVTGLDEEDIALRGGLPAGVQIMRKPVPFDRLLGIAQDLHEAANPAQMHSVDASHNWTN